jgi:hypothetical protein
MRRVALAGGPVIDNLRNPQGVTAFAIFGAARPAYLQLPRSLWKICTVIGSNM